MRHAMRFTLTVLAVVFLAGPALAGPTYITTGTYDESSFDQDTGTNGTQNNAVDTEPAGNARSLSAFTSDVATAFDNDSGGVVDFENTSETALNDGIDSRDFAAEYGAGGSKTLNLSFGDMPTTAKVKWRDGTVGQWQEISAVGNLFKRNGSDNAYSLNVDGIDGAPGAERVTQLAFTVLSRSTFDDDPTAGGDSTNTVTATANFSGGGASTTVSSDIGATVGGDDTFFSFQAPAGESITRIDLTREDFGSSNNNARLPFDDVAFITTIPEPASLTLLAPAGLLMLRRRR